VLWNRATATDTACGANGALVLESCQSLSWRARLPCAHLVDHVFPSVPLRQWVLSVLFELWLLLARNHRALSAVGRTFVRE
jgi:hypothetical protein